MSEPELIECGTRYLSSSWTGVECDGESICRRPVGHDGAHGELQPSDPLPRRWSAPVTPCLLPPEWAR